MRSLEAFIECNGQWERAARQLVLSPSHAALPDPARRGADRPVAGLRARPHRLLARAARARADPPVKERNDMKVGVPTEIKTDEYRVALTPAGVRELVEHGHEVVIQAGAGEGSAISDGDYASQGAQILPDAAAVFGEADMIVKVKEPQPVEVGDARAAPHAVHLPAPGARPRAHARAGGVRRDLRRLRDGRGHARAAAAAGADERGGGQDRHAGGRVHAREAARRPRDPARRRAGRGGGERDDHRRRRGRHERGVHRARDGGDGLRLRPQHRPPARARHRLRRPRGHVLRLDAGHRDSGCPRPTW